MIWRVLLLSLVGCTGSVVPDEIVLRPIGRVSEPSHNVAPQGSLLKSENCVLREQGTLAPLPDLVAGSVGTGSLPVARISPLYARRQMALLTDAFFDAGSEVVDTSDMSTAIQYENVEGNLVNVRVFRLSNVLVSQPFWGARQNMYLADVIGTYKRSQPGEDLERLWDVTSLVAGDIQDIQAESWLPDGEYVRYRTVLVFEDSNGVVRRSHPSVATAVVNTSGDPRTTFVAVYITNEDVYGSLKNVEVYRSRNFPQNVQTPNEYYLVKVIGIDQFTPSVGRVVFGFEDEIAPENLGQSLYTNSSQDGPESGNIVPPSSIYQATFRGHQFWGDVAGKEFFPELRRLPGEPIQVAQMTGVSTNLGDPDVTVTDLAGAQVGMSILSDASVFPVGTYITDIAGAGPFTVTMSEDALASDNADIFMSESVFIRWGDGTTSRFRLDTLSSPVDPGNGQLFSFQFPLDRIPWEATYIYASKHRCARLGTARLWVSNPDLFEQNADWGDLATENGAPTSGGAEALPAVFRERLVWSKIDEPENTTSLSFLDMDDPIVGLGAVRDALIVLTTKGAHSLTGVGGDFRVDPISTEVPFVGGQSVQVMDDLVYALSLRGLERVSKSDVQWLTKDIVGDWFSETPVGDPGDVVFGPRLDVVSQFFVAEYAPPTVFAAADLVHKEYALVVAGVTTPNLAFRDEALVFNAKTQAFTTWYPFLGVEHLPVTALGYAPRKTVGSDVHEPGILVGIDAGTLSFYDNRRASEPHTDHAQDIRFRARIEGDPTHLKMWTELAYDLSGDATILETVFQDESDPEIVQAVSGFLGFKEVRIWPPLNAARSAKLVSGLRGNGITVHALRASYVSSGRRVPL